MFGMICFSVYLIIYGNMTAFSKWMVGINSGAGFLLITSYLVGTFQQYSQYLTFKKAQDEMNKPKEEEEEKGVSYVN